MDVMLFLIETSNDNFVNKFPIVTIFTSFPLSQVSHCHKFPIVTIVTLKKTEQDEEWQGAWARDLEDPENHHKGDRHLFNEGDLGGLGGDGNKY